MTLICYSDSFGDLAWIRVLRNTLIVVIVVAVLVVVLALNRINRIDTIDFFPTRASLGCKLMRRWPRDWSCVAPVERLMIRYWPIGRRTDRIGVHFIRPRRYTFGRSVRPSVRRWSLHPITFLSKRINDSLWMSIGQSRRPTKKT